VELVKVFKVEPAYKKSVVEQNHYSKEIDGVTVYVTYEEVWRWGEFLIRFPETDDEWEQYAEENGYADIEEAKENYTIPEHLTDGIEFEDYDWELISTWDGCASYWSGSCYPKEEMEPEKLQEIIDELERQYSEESVYPDELGWTESCDYWIEGEFTLTEVEEGEEYEH
jgi:hypothetical protein